MPPTPTAYLRWALKTRNVDLLDPDGWMECSENGDTATISEVADRAVFRCVHELPRCDKRVCTAKSEATLTEQKQYYPDIGYNQYD